MLPIFQSDSSAMALMQTQWASQLNPVIKLPTNQGIIKQNVNLINGTTVVNHLLGRVLQGWFIVRQRASASIYDNQDTNSMPDLTLVLVSSAAVSVDLFLF